MIRGEGRMVPGSGGRSTPQALDVQGRRFSGHLSALGGGITDTFNRPDSAFGDIAPLGYSDSGHQWTNDFGSPPGDGGPESMIENGRLHVIRFSTGGTQTTHLGGPLNVYDTRAQGPSLLPGAFWDCTFEWELTSLAIPRIQFWNGGLDASVGSIDFFPGPGDYGPNLIRLTMMPFGIGSTTSSDFSHTFVAGVVHKLRWFFDGTAVRLKIWLASETQPTAWTYEHTGPPVGFEQVERQFSVSYEFSGGTGTIYIENLDIVGVPGGFMTQARTIVDTFNRPDGDLGISDSGFAWSWFLGVPPSISSSRAQMPSGSTGYLNIGSIPLPAEVTWEFERGTVFGPNPIFVFDNAVVAFAVPDGTIAIVYANLSSAFVEAPFVPALGVVYKFRLHLEPNTIRMRVWALTDPEPSTWLLELTDVAGELDHSTTFSMSAGGDPGDPIFVDNLQLVVGIGGSSGGGALKGHGRIGVTP